MSTALTFSGAPAPRQFVHALGICIPTYMSGSNPIMKFGRINRVCNYMLFLEASSTGHPFLHVGITIDYLSYSTEKQTSSGRSFHSQFLSSIKLRKATKVSSQYNYIEQRPTRIIKIRYKPFIVPPEHCHTSPKFLRLQITPVLYKSKALYWSVGTAVPTSIFSPFPVSYAN